MSNQFPKLQAKLEEIQTKLDELLRVEFIDKDLVEDVELKISVENFTSRSATTKLSYALRQSLEGCLVETGKVSSDDVSAAQALLKLGKYRETAISVLTKAIERKAQPLKTKSPEEKEAHAQEIKDTQEVKNLALKALAECGSEIANFDVVNSSSKYSNEIQFFDRENAVGYIDICGGSQQARCYIYWNERSQRLEANLVSTGETYCSNGICWIRV